MPEDFDFEPDLDLALAVDFEPDLDLAFEPDFEPDFDLALEADFDFVPDFDFAFEPDFEPDLDLVFDLFLDLVLVARLLLERLLAVDLFPTRLELAVASCLRPPLSLIPAPTAEVLLIDLEPLSRKAIH